MCDFSTPVTGRSPLGRHAATPCSRCCTPWRTSPPHPFFIVGSILFFFEQTKIPATFCFLFGSIFFVAKPSIRLARELWLAKLRDVDRLAALAPEGPGSFEELADDDQRSPDGQDRDRG